MTDMGQGLPDHPLHYDPLGDNPGTVPWAQLVTFSIGIHTHILETTEETWHEDRRQHSQY